MRGHRNKCLCWAGSFQKPGIVGFSIDDPVDIHGIVNDFIDRNIGVGQHQLSESL